MAVLAQGRQRRKLIHGVATRRWAAAKKEKPLSKHLLASVNRAQNTTDTTAGKALRARRSCFVEERIHHFEWSWSGFKDRSFFYREYISLLAAVLQTAKMSGLYSISILENWVKIFNFCVTHKSYYKVAKPHNCLDFTRKVGFPRFSMNWYSQMSEDWVIKQQGFPRVEP